MRLHVYRCVRALTTVGAIGAVVLCAQPLVGGDVAGGVDFRMTPLEQAKKLHSFAADRIGADVTFSVMESAVTCGDGQHIMISAAEMSPQRLRDQLAPESIAGVSWSVRDDAKLFGTCDSNAECKEKTEDLCEDAGHGGIKTASVSITVHIDGSKTCSADCKENGAIAFVTCNVRPSR